MNNKAQELSADVCKLIHKEFGDVPIGRGFMKNSKFWPDLIDRIESAVEKAYDKGQQDCLGVGNVIVPEKEHNELIKEREHYNKLCESIQKKAQFLSLDTAGTYLNIFENLFNFLFAVEAKDKPAEEQKPEPLVSDMIEKVIHKYAGLDGGPIYLQAFIDIQQIAAAHAEQELKHWLELSEKDYKKIQDKIQVLIDGPGEVVPLPDNNRCIHTPVCMHYRNGV